jgi:curved DNA-binding protein CbpA
MIAEFVNHYAVLGVHAGCGNEEIRAAYLRLAREHHPDRGGDAARFAAVATAYHALKDAPRRQATAAFWRVTRTRCQACGGAGHTRTGRGFTGVTLTGCDACGGAGYL